MDIDATASAAASAPKKAEPVKTKEPAPTPASAQSSSSSTSSSPAAAAAPKEPITVTVPVMGESITSGTVGKWFVTIGESVDAEQVVAQIDTDKVNVEVRAPVSGKITKMFAEEGQEISVGGQFFLLAPGPGPAGSSSTSSSSSSAAASKPVTTEQPKKPVEQPQQQQPKKEEKKSSPTTGPAQSSSSSSVSAVDRSESRVKMTRLVSPNPSLLLTHFTHFLHFFRMRLRIADRLKESQNTAAMLTTFQECDMGNLIDLRNRFKDDFEKSHGVKLGFMSAFVKAATAALQETPAVNAVIDDQTQEIVFRNYCDISVAVASPTGLVVPVLRNTEKMSFAVSFHSVLLLSFSFPTLTNPISLLPPLSLPLFLRMWRNRSPCTERKPRTANSLWKTWPEVSESPDHDIIPTHTLSLQQAPSLFPTAESSDRSSALRSSIRLSRRSWACMPLSPEQWWLMGRSLPAQ
jgi:2-oxoglutarate dehydrogenase E2 component (dihydrolipoamide succinyltransferase)